VGFTSVGGGEGGLKGGGLFWRNQFLFDLLIEHGLLEVSL